MLLFVDQPKRIRVFRMEDDGSAIHRVRVGAINKNTLEVPAELKESLNPAEIEEIEGVIGHYSSVEAAQAKLDVARFPTIVRNVVEHISSAEIGEVERALLVTALMDAVKQLRKAERAAKPE